ncbi:unnamed protein product [Dibothriocephalus latus]|uniref:Uncharacterized protein n=1 Tax=Dibothriocephalus latus TaxID=60516 RepID=A0A3P7M336_DIBLA|nr:unnamed protein product [Dibothriocephalus latus]
MRHFPGAATRVKALTADFSGTALSATNQHIFSKPRSKSLRSASMHIPLSPERKASATKTELMERLFVKTPAKRILNPSKYQPESTPGTYRASEVSKAQDATEEVTKAATAPSSLTSTPVSPSEDVKAASVTTAAMSSETEEPRQRGSGQAIEMLPLEPLTTPPALPAESPACLGVCIPIPSLISLNTHKNLNELMVGRCVPLAFFV